jgi:hypothetical protein
MVGRDAYRLLHVLAEFEFVPDYLHGASAQNVRRTYEYGIADFLGEFESLLFAASGATFGLAHPHLVHEFVEPVAVLR